jgi:hypothetical protein
MMRIRDGKNSDPGSAIKNWEFLFFCLFMEGSESVQIITDTDPTGTKNTNRPDPEHCIQHKKLYTPVLRIHDILGWIRIRILDPDPAIFVIDLQDASKNLFFNTIFSAFYFLKLNLHHFLKIKSQKE